MSWAHTSELDRLRLCQRTATDLRGFHLQNPPFLCMLMCLCTQWQQECTWQSMCTVVWITVHMNECVCVLISDCLHPWLSDFAHYPLLFFLLKDWRHFFVSCFLADPSPSCRLASFLYYPITFCWADTFSPLIFHCCSLFLFQSQTYSTLHVVSCGDNTNVCLRMERNWIRAA